MRLVALIFATLVLCFTSTQALAVTQIGPIAGFSFSNLRIDGESGQEGRSSFTGGVAFDFGINERTGIRVEPSFVSKGARATKRNAYWGTIDSAEFDLNYINFPVLARYDLAETETRGYLLGGLALGFATNREMNLTQAQEHESIDFADVFKSTDLTIDFGLGISFDAGGQRMTMDGRASYGLTSINDGGTVTFQGAPLDVPSTSTHTLAFRLLATYFLWSR